MTSLSPSPAPERPPAILVEGLFREYVKNGKPVVAVDGVDLSVGQGELFGLLGPNGAGKTTLIRILTTLLLPTRGVARVAGHSVVGEEAFVRRRINMVSGGETSGYGLLTVEENVWMFSQFYGIPTRVAMERIDRLLGALALADQRKTRVDSLSTGMRQKMNIIRGLVTEPDVLFLDEPTLGLDVHAARQVRAFLKEWMAARPDRTILLTTHSMHEADEMCDRVAIIDHGKILACDTPRALKARLDRQVSLTITVDREPDPAGRPAGIVNHSVTPVDDADAFELLCVLRSEPDVADVLRWVLDSGATVMNLSKREATLEDVFVSLVGKGLSS